MSRGALPTDAELDVESDRDWHIGTSSPLESEWDELAEDYLRPEEWGIPQPVGGTVYRVELYSSTVYPFSVFAGETHSVELEVGGGLLVGLPPSHLQPTLSRVLALAFEVTGHQAGSPRTEYDPENEDDWWIAIPLRCRGSTDQVLNTYEALIEKLVEHIPAAKRERIRIDLQVEE
ncbi:MAG: hypothetical protein WBD05_04530 [Phycisphaerae bacterium]